jgi:hypothetical protein
VPLLQILARARTSQPVGIVPLSAVTGAGMQLLLAAAGSAAPRRDVSAQPASAAAAGT